MPLCLCHFVINADFYPPLLRMVAVKGIKNDLFGYWGSAAACCDVHTLLEQLKGLYNC